MGLTVSRSLAAALCLVVSVAASCGDERGGPAPSTSAPAASPSTTGGPDVTATDRPPFAAVSELVANGMTATAKFRVLDYRGDLERLTISWSSLLRTQTEELEVGDLELVDDPAALRAYEIVREFDFSGLPVTGGPEQRQQFGVEPRAYDSAGETSPSNIYPVFLPQERDCNALAPGVKQPEGLPACSDPFDE